MSLAIVVAAPLLSTVFVTVSIRILLRPYSLDWSQALLKRHPIYIGVPSCEVSLVGFWLFSLFQKYMVDRQVYVFTKSVNQAPTLAKACSSFETKVFRARTFKQSIEHHCYPTILSNANWSILNFSSARCNSAKRSGLVCFIQSAIIN